VASRIACADPSLPLRSDGQPFTGSNAWLLSFAGAVGGYASPYWFTFRQALGIGAPVMREPRARPRSSTRPVAEIGAAALGLRIGLRPQLLDGHAANLAHWAAILKERPAALLEASGHARRAVDHLEAFSRVDVAATSLAA